MPPFVQCCYFNKFHLSNSHLAIHFMLFPSHNTQAELRSLMISHRAAVSSSLWLCGAQWTYMLDLPLYGTRCLP